MNRRNSNSGLTSDRSTIRSLAPYRDYRVNLRRLARGKVASQQRREDEQERNDGKGRRIAGADAEEQALHRPGRRPRRRQPNGQTEQRQFQSLTDDQFEHVASLRSQGQANADLALAFADGPG